MRCFSLAPLACALSLAYPAAGFAQAEPTPPAAEPPRLPTITVSATRTERAADEVPASVTTHTAADVAERQAGDLKRLLEDEPDLAVRAPAARFSTGSGSGRAGQEGLNIRGLEGNQVLVLVDGVRLPSAFSFGPFGTGRLDTVDPDTLATAEVLRGPSSSQFGSDGLAGALSLRLLRPADLLGGEPGSAGTRRTAGFVKLGGDSVDRSTVATAAVAWGGDTLQALLLASHRQGHETDNQGDNAARNETRTAPNPLDTRATSVLGSLAWRLDAQHALDATVEGRRLRQDATMWSAVAVEPALPGPGNPFANQTLAFDAKDETERLRVSVVHRWRDERAAGLTGWQTTVYAQRAETTQFHAEDRAFSADRTRDNRYTERIVGLSTQGTATLRGALPQRLSFGLDASRSELSAERGGTVPPFGETYPSNPFPDTRFTQAGAFVQSEIDTERVTVIPALRFDRFSLSPRDTAGFTGTAVSLSDQAVTPRLGAIWRVSPAFAPYAQWSLGFRAPQPDQVNNGFSNPASGYVSIGNPELKPEHARSVELGARGELAPGVAWQLAAYDNRYRDFISQQMVGGSFTPTDPAVFQYVNLSDAHIRGGELRLDAALGSGWSARAALAKAEGSSEVDGVREPLETIQPLRWLLALRHDAGRWHVMAQWQHHDGKAAEDVPSDSRASAFLPPAADVVDLFATWRVDRTWSLRGAVRNLFDETWWRWSDMRGLSASAADGSANPALPAYTAPGRSVQLALRADF